MPNQIAKSKRRQSLTEHKAVLAALSQVADDKGTTCIALMRQALRDLIAKHADDPDEAAELRSVVMQLYPTPPDSIDTPAQLARFKREQREFDKVLLDLRLVAPEGIEYRNSIVSPQEEMHVLELEADYAADAAK